MIAADFAATSPRVQTGTRRLKRKRGPLALAYLWRQDDEKGDASQAQFKLDDLCQGPSFGDIERDDGIGELLQLRW